MPNPDDSGSRRLLRSRHFDEALLRAVDWYAEEAGVGTAVRLVDEVEAVARSIRDHPDLGSEHAAEVSGVPGLRSRRIRDFPYLVYFTYDTTTATLWTLLHGRRDLPAALYALDQPD